MTQEVMGPGEDNCIANIWPGTVVRKSVEEVLANAALIAAAPVLYEALKEALAMAEDGFSFHPGWTDQRVCDHLRAALALAEGRPAPPQV